MTRRTDLEQPVFGPKDEAIAGRVRLSLATTAHLEAMAGWLAGALAPDWPFDDLRPWVEQGVGVLISVDASVPIGLAVAIVGAPEKGAACVPLIAVDPSRRFRGLGGEAAIALERHLRARFGVERVYAPVPDGRGLAVYFWLRAGYRPLTVAEAPWPLVGLTAEPRPGIWMLRDED